MQLEMIHLIRMLLVALLLVSRSASLPSCRYAVEVLPKDCRYGTVRHFCGVNVCAKGPGESCSNWSLSSRKCGVGLTCLCERCHGCSLQQPGDCYNETNLCFQ